MWSTKPQRLPPNPGARDSHWARMSQRGILHHHPLDSASLRWVKKVWFPSRTSALLCFVFAVAFRVSPLTNDSVVPPLIRIQDSYL